MCVAEWTLVRRQVSAMEYSWTLVESSEDCPGGGGTTLVSSAVMPPPGPAGASHAHGAHACIAPAEDEGAASQGPHRLIIDARRLHHLQGKRSSAD